jgi:hypothetical protein
MVRRVRRVKLVGLVGLVGRRGCGVPAVLGVREAQVLLAVRVVTAGGCWVLVVLVALVGSVGVVVGRGAMGGC